MTSEVDLLLIFSTIIILIVVLMMLFIYIYFLRQKSKLIIENKEKKLKFEQELAQSLIEMKEQTLNFVGQELHDDIGQKLSVAMLLAAKAQTVRNDTENNDLNEIRMILGECIRDIRNLSRTFMTNHIEHFGLVESLKMEVDRLQRLDFVSVNFHYNNFDVDINRKDSVILFRMIQECIHNSLEHSKAKNLEINLIDSDDELNVTVSDNGIGMKESQIVAGGGLSNMKNRAAMINAVFEISGGDAPGTEIKIKYHKP